MCVVVVFCEYTALKGCMEAGCHRAAQMGPQFTMSIGSQVSACRFTTEVGRESCLNVTQLSVTLFNLWNWHSPDITAFSYTLAAFVCVFLSSFSCTSFPLLSHPFLCSIPLSFLLFLLSSPYIALWSYIKKKALPILTFLWMLIKNVIFSLQKPFRCIPPKLNPGETLAELYNSHMALSRNASRHGEYLLQRFITRSDCMNICEYFNVTCRFLFACIHLIWFSSFKPEIITDADSDFLDVTAQKTSWRLNRRDSF